MCLPPSISFFSLFCSPWKFEFFYFPYLFFPPLPSPAPTYPINGNSGDIWSHHHHHHHYWPGRGMVTPPQSWKAVTWGPGWSHSTNTDGRGCGPAFHVSLEICLIGFWLLRQSNTCNLDMGLWGPKSVLMAAPLTTLVICTPGCQEQVTGRKLSCIGCIGALAERLGMIVKQLRGSCGHI